MRLTQRLRDVLIPFFEIDEVPVVLLTRDAYGDIIAYDLTREGLVIHGPLEDVAVQRLLALRPEWDDFLAEPLDT